MTELDLHNSMVNMGEYADSTTTYNYAEIWNSAISECIAKLLSEPYHNLEETVNIFRLLMLRIVTEDELRGLLDRDASWLEAWLKAFAVNTHPDPRTAMMEIVDDLRRASKALKLLDGGVK